MVVGVFDTYDRAEEAVRTLIDAGIPPEHISIIARDLQARERVTGYVTMGEMARDLAGAGAWVGGLFGLLTGAVAFLWLPVVGPLVVIGPLVAGAIGALEGGAVGGLLGAILGKQLEKDRVLKYEQDLQAGKLLVAVHGTAQELETVRRVMAEYAIQDVTTYEERAA
jgi:hypothetical protein